MPAASARRASSGALIERMIPAEPHLQRHRHRYGADGRLDQAQRVIEIAHQRRSRFAVRHVTRGTAHVDVDDVGAGGFRDPRAFGHPLRLAAGKLHHMRTRRRRPRIAAARSAGPCARSSLAVISETTRPAPSSAASFLNGASVTPDIGASTTGTLTGMPPIAKGLACDGAGLVTILPIMFSGPTSPLRKVRAQKLGRSVHCLHFRHFCGRCKCTAAKVLKLPTGLQNLAESSVSVRRVMVRACADTNTCLNRISTLPVPKPHASSHSRHHRRRRPRPPRRARRTQAIPLARRAHRRRPRAGRLLRASGCRLGAAGVPRRRQRAVCGGDRGPDLSAARPRRSDPPGFGLRRACGRWRSSPPTSC